MPILCSFYPCLWVCPGWLARKRILFLTAFFFSSCFLYLPILHHPPCSPAKLLHTYKVQNGFSIMDKNHAPFGRQKNHFYIQDFHEQSLQIKSIITTSSPVIAFWSPQKVRSCGTDSIKPHNSCFPAIPHALQSSHEWELGTSVLLTDKIVKHFGTWQLRYYL